MLSQGVSQLARGFFMGAADIVPGVSGGTIALILGIYRRLIANIRMGAHALRQLVSGKLADAVISLGRVEWSFLVPLGAGVVVAFLLLRHPMENLLTDRPEGTAAVFCGLVGASSWIVWQQVTTRDRTRMAVLIAVAVTAFVLLGFQNGAVADPSLLPFAVTGAIAICAMILPGISGSFLMLMLGMYGAVLGGSPLELLVFLLGAVVGLGAFSSLLNWLLVNHEQTVLAALLGLMIGSIRVLWPWPNGVGVISDEADEVIKGTSMDWPSTTALLGGAALAVASAAATLLIVHYAEARSD